MKYILVTGGGMSGIGKGVVASSIGALLRSCDIEVTAIKIDPYLNYDAGTFSPYEHGEVFVLDDGSEVDLDLGNYERFLDTKLNGSNNITTGKIYRRVLDRERRGDYLGKTVQMIPHLTDAIIEWIETTASGQICIIELGGVIGDIEGMAFLEALRQLRRRVKRDNFCCCLVNPVPCIGPSKEHKSKLTQESTRKLGQSGLNPDMIICRSELSLTNSVKEKISLFCDVELDNIFSLPDLKTIYQVPTELDKQGMIRTLSNCLKLPLSRGDLNCWSVISDIAINAQDEVTIALVGKYTSLSDCYASVIKSLQHACYSMQFKPNIRFIESSDLEDDKSSAWELLKTSDCLLVPGGFGLRGVEGKIRAISYARKMGMPFLGICLGFQMAVIEWARSNLGINNAHSGEFSDELTDITPIVIEMLEYKDPENKLGGTMRLGLRKTKFVTEDSILRKLYGTDTVEERHRHRYEINPDFIDLFENSGLKFVGRDGNRMEILELDPKVHPYFVAVQYHPEYLSRPFKPSPPYKGLVEAGRSFAKAK